MYGYAGKILRVDLSKRSYEVTGLDKKVAKMFIGGRGFNIARLYWEVPPEISPLSEHNKLMLSTGPLAGTGFPLGSRLNVSARSPQTGLLGDSNVGGHFGAEMKYAGFDQIIIEGKSDKPVYLYITESGVEFMDAEGLWGLRVSEAHREILRELGDWRVQTAIIGPAAENFVKFAGIFFNVHRPAARTGMGTVMASKNLKAIAVRGDGFVEVAKPEEFEKLVEEIELETYAHEEYWSRRIMGTSRILLAANRIGVLPGRHFTEPEVDYAYLVSGERLALEYNVKTRGCFSCVVPCSRVFLIKRGKYAGIMGEGPEYEALAGMTVRIGNSDLDAALYAVKLINDLGLDVISTSEVISWLMELYERGDITSDEIGGLKPVWGDMETVLTLIEDIAYRRGVGDVLADGVLKAAEKLGKGKDIAMQVKGLEMIQADPRGLKGYGLGFAVSTRGADHLRSEPFVELTDNPELCRKLLGIPEACKRLGVRGKGVLVAHYENLCAVVDAIEVCKNLAENMNILDYEKVARLIHVTTGMKMTARDVELVGERIINMERAYIARLGVRREHDRLPERFLRKPLPKGASKGHVIELEPMLEEYYRIRKWDPGKGIPTEKRLKELGLEDVATDLKERGVF
ncbi:aor-1 tungsten-containing aldehyde ferredoxin oxidoreductase [Pyrococcus abyssi GE5]|uniref:Aor-1 tungsten-containing aldehyde ferredoxin oxidoreductase n=1 Tax=Pyrococcus abyssi (strain GE5 / Orsay) TaxID=272844 RepID=Q9V1N1_PYRAB|nr:aor-1 tungsten-containing aldehyde ferredoxin oxidoreductase [Pyrococcus abyssi GE5]